MKILINILGTLLLLPWPGIIMMSPMLICSEGFSEEKTSILTGLLVLNYPFLFFVLLHLLDQPFYGTRTIWWAVGCLLISGSLTIAYGLPRMLVNSVASVPNHGLHQTDKHVYFHGRRIRGADPETFMNFEEQNDYYSKDANSVFYGTKRLKLADAPSFQPAGDQWGVFWKDGNRVYVNGKAIPGSDGASFEYLGERYGRDRNQVYWESGVVPGADPESFSPRGHFVGRDKNTVYVQTFSATNIRDPETFEFFQAGDEVFARDARAVYAVRYNRPDPLVPFPEADPETFEVLGNFYARDKDRVYHYSYHQSGITVIEEADPGSFHLEWDRKTGADARDRVHLFKWGELVRLENGGTAP